jgi:hypothetical protein
MRLENGVSMKTNVAMFLAGVLVCVAGSLLIGAAEITPPTVARFQIILSGHHAFVVDTATGRTWKKFLSDDQGLNAPKFEDSKLSAE